MWHTQRSFLSIFHLGQSTLSRQISSTHPSSSIFDQQSSMQVQAMLPPIVTIIISVNIPISRWLTTFSRANPTRPATKNNRPGYRASYLRPNFQDVSPDGKIEFEGRFRRMRSPWKPKAQEFLRKVPCPERAGRGYARHAVASFLSLS